MEEILRDLNLKEFLPKIKAENIGIQAFEAFNLPATHQKSNSTMTYVLRAKVGMSSGQIMKICSYLDRKKPTPTLSDVSRNFAPRPTNLTRQQAPAAFTYRAGGSKRSQMMLGKS
jgi:hypothetical protein